MKTLFKTFKAVALIVMTVSCDSKSDNVAEIEKQTKTEIESSYELLDLAPNVYHDYFKQADNTIGYSSLKSAPLKETTVIEYSSLSPLAKQKTSVKINGFAIKVLETNKKLSSRETNSIYGKTVTFIISASNSKTGKISNAQEVVMYVPNIVSISNPEVKKKQEQYPFCTSEDFVLEWNADSQNKEGLVVIAEYFGINAVPTDSQSTHVLNTDYIAEDNGKVTLNGYILILTAFCLKSWNIS